jgi:hypothetical protein
VPGTSQLNTRRRAGSARLERRSAARFVASPCAPAAMSGMADTDINTIMRGADDAVIAIGVFYLLIGAFNVQSTMQSRRHPLGAACQPVLAVHVHVGVTVGLAGYRLWKYTIFVLGFIIVGTVVAVLAIKLPFSPLHDDGDATDALIVWVIAGLM